MHPARFLLLKAGAQDEVNPTKPQRCRGGPAVEPTTCPTHVNPYLHKAPAALLNYVNLAVED